MEDQVNIIHDWRPIKILCSCEFAYVVFFKVRLGTHVSSYSWYVFLAILESYIKYWWLEMNSVQQWTEQHETFQAALNNRRLLVQFSSAGQRHVFCSLANRLSLSSLCLGATIVLMFENSEEAKPLLLSYLCLWMFSHCLLGNYSGKAQCKD